MLLRSIRRALAPQNLIMTALIALSMTGVAVAAAVGTAQLKKNAVTTVKIKNKAVTSAKIRNNAVTSAKIKNRSIIGADIKNNAIKGRQIDESTLTKVPTAGHADTAAAATNATRAAGADLADRTTGHSRFWTGFLPVTSENDDPVAARDAATLVTVAEAGSLKIQVACFRDVDHDRVYAAVLATTTANGAILDSWWDYPSGGNTFNSADFLNTDTARDDRRIYEAYVGANTYRVPSSGNGQAPFTMIGADGTYLTGGVNAIVRNGTPAGAPALPGATRSCAFVGEVTHS